MTEDKKKDEVGATWCCPDHPRMGSTTQKGAACSVRSCNKKMTQRKY